MNKTKRLVTLSAVVALAMVLSYLERLLPEPPIPGIKLGLANIAVIFTLYKLGWREALAVSLLRVILLSMLFGTLVSFFYAVAGATVSFIVMLLLKSLTPLNTITVSIVGAISHNLAQILVACFLFDTNLIVYYLPFLIISGTVAGIAIGVAGAMLVRRVKIGW